jgi:hypothetical protein
MGGLIMEDKKYSVWVNDYEYLGLVPIKNLNFTEAQKLANSFIADGFDDVEIEEGI